MNIFSFKNYKPFLRKLIDSERASYTRLLCEAANIHRSYFSQMINGDKELSLEQAKGISEYIPLTDEETKYFLLLVQKDRAGTTELKKFFQNEINEISEKKTGIGEQVPNKKSLTAEQMAIFHSSWRYAVICILLQLKENQTNSVEKISLITKIEKDIINNSLAELDEMGLITKKGNKWIPSDGNVYFRKGQHHTNKFHSNLRNFSQSKAMNRSEGDEFFTMTHAMSIEAYEKLKKEIREFIVNKMNTEISPSKSEVAVLFSYDLIKF